MEKNMRFTRNECGVKRCDVISLFGETSHRADAVCPGLPAHTSCHFGMKCACTCAGQGEVVTDPCKCVRARAVCVWACV